jgi:DNA polymerase-3 subunit epsilon
MGRCLSPCLGDLDPNLYRERLDRALRLFLGDESGAGALLAHVDEQMRVASAAQQYERAAWLRRRHARLRGLLAKLGGVLRATHAGTRLVLGRHPSAHGRFDAFWIAGGRVVDWGPLPGAPEELLARSVAAVRATPRRELGGWLPAGEVAEARLVGAWVAAHEPPRLELHADTTSAQLAEFVRRAAHEAA